MRFHDEILARLAAPGRFHRGSRGPAAASSLREKAPEGQTPRAALAVTDLEKILGEGRALSCSACRRRITTTAARIDVGGRHEHTCENPHGFVYRIGCFAIAENLVAFGNASTYWSWFPGYSWQVQQCAGCRALLGWLFARAEQRFFGLILDHLVETDDSE